MDKVGANYESCLKAIEEKFKIVSIPVQIPIGHESEFCGIVDLVNFTKITWHENNLGKKYKVENILKTDHDFNKIAQYRRNAIEKLAQVDNEFAEILLERFNFEYEKMNDNLLFDSFLRKACIKTSVIPVLCGSSLKNIAIQPLMDAVIKYLPNPKELEKNDFSKDYGSDLVAVCFKTIHDHQKSRKRLDPETEVFNLQLKTTNKQTKYKIEDSEEDILSFVRVYNGELIGKSSIFNPNKEIKETCQHIYIPHSNKFQKVTKISAGNIAIINGLTKVSFLSIIFIILFKFLFF